MKELELANYLEEAWYPGVLYGLRQGSFDLKKANELLNRLKNTQLADHEKNIDRKLVSLLWYMPLFLSWQRERVAARPENPSGYQQFENAIASEIERLLGIP